MNIPTAHSTESLERFLQHIKSSPTPKVVSRSYLKDSGFVSGNDPELRHIFRLLKFLNDKDQPQLRWMKYKARGNAVLQEAIYECYKSLFAAIPDAPQAKNEALESWFKPPLTGETRSSVERAIRTFRKLCQFAAIGLDNQATLVENIAKETKPNSPAPTFRPNVGLPPTLVLNVPAFTDKADYIRYFEALKEVFYK